MTENVGSDFNQIAAQLSFIPTGEHIRHFFIIQINQILHHPISFGNQLHITVLNTIVNHLHKMSRTGRAYPLATRCTIRCFCCNTLKNRLHFRPCFFRTTGHDRRTVQRSFFPSGHTTTDEKKTFRFGQFDTPVGIFIIGVTTVDKNISGRKQRKKLFHQFVYRTSGTNHHHYFTRGSYRINECFYICESFNIFTFCTAIHKAVYDSFFHSGNSTVVN